MNFSVLNEVDTFSIKKAVRRAVKRVLGDDFRATRTDYDKERKLLSVCVVYGRGVINSISFTMVNRDQILDINGTIVMSDLVRIEKEIQNEFLTSFVPEFIEGEEE